MIPSLKPTREEKLYQNLCCPERPWPQQGHAIFNVRLLSGVRCFFKGLKGSHHTNENKLKINLKWKLNKHFAHLLSKATIVAV